MVTTVSASAEFAALARDHAAQRGTDGVLSVLYLPDVAERRRLAAARLPLVVIDPPTEPGSDIQSVGTTNWQGGMAATRHLGGPRSPPDRCDRRPGAVLVGRTPGWTATGPR